MTEISALTGTTGAATAPADLLVTVDVSDTSMAASGTDKKITLAEFVIGLRALGLGGGTISIPYIFSTTTTDSDPGNGTLRLSNATQLSATVIRADLLDSLGTDWSGVLGAIAASTNAVKGYILLAKENDPTKYILFTVSALASPSGYKNITVAEVGASGANPFLNGDAIVMTFDRAGDQGATGASGSGTVGMTDAQQMQFVDYTAGSDSNDGLSWTTARKTIASALAHIIAGEFGGEIFISVNGAHIVSTVIELPSGVGLHAAKPGTIAGSYGGAAVIRWQGADSGYVIKTGAVTYQSDPTVGYDWSTIDGIAIQIPTVTATSSNPGGGNPNAGGAAYTTIIPWGLRNWQNLCEIRDCAALDFPDKGFYWFAEPGSGRADAPGWCAARRCWTLSATGAYPFYQECGDLNMLYDQCGADAGLTTVDTFTIAPNTEGGSGVRQVITFKDCKVEGSSLATMGTHGTTGDCGFIHVLSGAAVEVVVIGGCAQQQGGTPAASPCIQYDAVETQINSRASGAAVTVVGQLSQTYGTWISCPNATPPILIKPANGAAGGTVDHWPTFDLMGPEYGWTGRVHGSDATTTGQTLTNVTGMSVPLDANHVYEFDAILLVTTSAVTTGTQYGVNFSASGATVEAIVDGHTTTTATGSCGLSALATATATTFLTTSAQAGVIRIKGVVTTGSNAGNLTVEHLKVTSGTSTVKIGSGLKAKQIA